MVEARYGRDGLADALASGLIGLDRKEKRRVARAYPDGHPVVRVVGGRGYGKTPVLDELYEGYNGWIPLVRADLADDDLNEADAEGPSQPVTNLLYLVSYHLGLQVSRARRALVLDRLALGLLVVTAWPLVASAEDFRPPDLRKAEEELREFIDSSGSEGKGAQSPKRIYLTILTEHASTLFPGPLGPMVRSVLTAAGEQLLSRRSNQAALRWWRERLPMYAGDPLQRLFALVRALRTHPVDLRGEVEGLLVAALFADIREHYGLLRRVNQLPPPLILLDNVHTPLGRHVMDLLLPAYAEAAGRTGCTLPVVVAVGLGGRAGLPELGEATGQGLWQRPAAGQPPRAWLLSVAITPKRTAEIKAKLGDTGYPPHTPRFLQRLSGGAVFTVDVLVKAVRQRDNPEQLSGRELLDSPAPDPSGADGARTVAERLLLRLVPEAGARDRLTLLSAALNDDGARVLLRAFHPELNAGAGLLEARSFLDEEHWTPVPWRGPDGDWPFVQDQSLRALLLHRLASTCDNERWARVHRLLRASRSCDPRGLPAYSAGHSTGYLHHTLALDELDAVVHCLHHRFATADPEPWLSALNLVCAAPCPPEGFTAEPGPPPPCPMCTGPGAVPVHHAIRRLVRAVWRASQPLCIAAREVDVDQVGAALHTLHEHNDTRDTYLKAHRQWPEALRQGAQAPGLPVPGENQT